MLPNDVAGRGKEGTGQSYGTEGVGAVVGGGPGAAELLIEGPGIRDGSYIGEDISYPGSDTD